MSFSAGSFQVESILPKGPMDFLSPLHPQVSDQTWYHCLYARLRSWAVELTPLLGWERRQGGLIGNSGLKNKTNKNHFNKELFRALSVLTCTAGFCEEVKRNRHTLQHFASGKVSHKMSCLQKRLGGEAVMTDLTFLKVLSQKHLRGLL